MPDLLASTIASPCRNICKVKRGVCTGCGRSLDEIAAWPTASDAEKLVILGRARVRIRR